MSLFKQKDVISKRSVVLGLYVITDKIAGESGPVFEAVNDGVAARQYQSFFLQYPECNPSDFCMLKLGFVDHCNHVLEAFSEAKDVTASVAIPERKENDMEVKNEKS